MNSQQRAAIMRASDQALADAINAYIASTRHPTRRGIYRHHKTSETRVKRLVAEGMIRNFPGPLDLRHASVMGAKASPWRHNFKLKGTPEFA